MRKITKAYYLLFLIITIVSCNNTNKKIAIVNLMKHPVLDAVENETKDNLLNMGYTVENGYEIITKNLNGQKELIPTVVNDIISQDPIVIVSITTPISQSFYGKAKCPIVFSLVTDPVEAGILDSIEQVKPNITGTADVFPYDKQLKLIRRIHPSAKTIGLIYDPGEAPARFALTQLKKLCPKNGFKLITKPATSTSEVPQAANAIIDEADILFISSDNTTIESVSSIVSLCIEKKKPFYVGETGSVEKGGIATYSVSYSSFGKATANLVDRVLKGEKNIPIYTPEDFEIVINTKAAELMSVKIDSSLIKEASKVYNKLK